MLRCNRRMQQLEAWLQQLTYMQHRTHQLITWKSMTMVCCGQISTAQTWSKQEETLNFKLAPANRTSLARCSWRTWPAAAVGCHRAIGLPVHSTAAVRTHAGTRTTPVSIAAAIG